MKKIMICCFIFTQLIANPVDEISKKLDMIRYEDTQKTEKITSINYDPFHTQKKDKKLLKKNDDKKVDKKVKLLNKIPNLSMIFNKKAFIDGKWYKENMKVADYFVKRINENSVMLEKKNKIITLRLDSKRNIFLKRGTDK